VLPHLGYLYIGTGQPQKARELYQELLSRTPPFKLDADAVLWLVRNLLESGDYEAMRKTLEMLPSRFPGTDFSHEIHFFSGESAMGLKDYKKALEEYSEAIKLKPKGTFAGSAHLGSGIAQLMLQDRAGAEVSFKEALSFDQEPNVALRARFEMANLLLAQGNLADAAKGFMLVAILYEDSKYAPSALYKAGECFRKINRAEEAQKAFAELRQRFPASEWAQKAKVFTEEANKK
ncbi:MAG: tetratricopeptide repeat protein, partial [Candidatus Omnitrophota bacterium]